jgi:hypothetical protein
VHITGRHEPLRSGHTALPIHNFKYTALVIPNPNAIRTIRLHATFVVDITLETCCVLEADPSSSAECLNTTQLIVNVINCGMHHKIGRRRESTTCIPSVFKRRLV